jgi:hypothetical protein
MDGNGGHHRLRGSESADAYLVARDDASHVSKTAPFVSVLDNTEVIPKTTCTSRDGHRSSAAACAQPEPKKLPQETEQTT